MTRHDQLNVKNRTLFIADNLDILRGINDECIDLIYLDPPFNTDEVYKAPIGSAAEGAEFKDIWTDEVIKHSVTEYVHGQASTNVVESLRFIRKGGYIGTYHKMSPTHRQRYIQEFEGQHLLCIADTLDHMELTIRQQIGKRLLYQDLVKRDSLKSGGRAMAS